MADTIKGIKTRYYSNFRGVDFSKRETTQYRSPDMLNMWKTYKEDDAIETRPGMRLLNNFGSQVYGLFFYSIDEDTHVLVHVGTKMLEWINYPNSPAETKELYTGLNPKEGKSFIYDNTFFFLDGINYLEFDGTTMKEVIGTIPVVSYWMRPDGSTSIDEETDTDLVYQAVNVLTPLRINRFVADGKSATYQLNAMNLDDASAYLMEATIDNAKLIENIDFTVDRKYGTVRFNAIPENGKEVYITYSKAGKDYRQRILNCNLICEFDNRIFFSGNKDYPNTVFHCELNDPRYVRDTAYYECGLDLARIKALIPGNSVLWVLKEMDQNNSSVYYMTPTLDNKYDKLYPSVNGSISLGCVSTGINFNDDIVFLSKNGLEGISTNSMYSEQILQHRSSNVDNKLINNANYNNVKIAEYNGYLVCLLGSKVFIADSRQKFQDEAGNIQYEWFYWELPYEMSYIKEYRGNLYLANAKGEIFVLDGDTDNELPIHSYVTTARDNFGYPSYSKTTNKRGNVVNLKAKNNDNIKLDTIVDGTLKEKTTISDAKGYAPFRIKDKKFKDIQIKFSSDKPFGLFSCTLQGFIAGYIKR